MKKTAIANALKTHLTILGSFVGIFWIVEIFDHFLFRDRLFIFGIIPRHFIGLRGILFAPFLHGSFGHLIANTVPFLVLGWLVMLQETSDFFIVTLCTMVVGGLGTWVFGSPAPHIGASILIFGYLGFLLLRGFFQRNIPSIVLSVVVGLTYGSAIWGIFPSDPRISWEGHLFGFIGGVLAARAIAKEKQVYRN